jgi:hypothetical protein
LPGVKDGTDEFGKADMGNIEHPTSNTEHPMRKTVEGMARADSRPTDVEISNPATGRMSVQTVERLHRLLGGDPHVEGMVLQFIASRYGAKDLFHLPPQVAREILKRPADFLRAVKEHCEPELRF